MWLAPYFSPNVTEPIRLHVDAKHYLCAIDHNYLNSLSPASHLSLTLQGGPMSSEECAAFRCNSAHQDAIRLRYWDDTAKVCGLQVPGLDHYHARLEAVVQAARSCPE